MRPSLRSALLASLIALALAGSALAQDTDGDGVPDAVDNCQLVANAAPADCDTDRDGFGNACDGDFDNNGVVNANDFSIYYVPDFIAASDSGVGTDMNCSNCLNSGCFGAYFVPQFQQGLPGPSGLACAGTVPCP